MIRPLIAGNWKMFKTVRESLDFVGRLKEALRDVRERDVVIAPPFTSLYPVGEALKGSNIRLAAQNLSDRPEGACTGEISARMLVDCGCTHVIVGHSERRTLFGEQDAAVAAKLKAAVRSGLTAIFCIGETLAEREGGRTFAVIERQIKEGLNQLSADDIKYLLIAYEPVWAIGTGRTATPEQAQEAHAFIRRVVAGCCAGAPADGLPILYGGSVNADNIGRLMAQRDINGALVGGASLDADSFAGIVKYRAS
jgi:triosephosphate isomerase